MSLLNLLADVSLQGTLEGLGGYQSADEPETKISTLISNIIGFLTIVAGLMFLIYFVLGALSWLMAGGDAERVEKAKKSMTDAAIGLIIVVVAYAIAGIIGAVLGFTILDPASLLETIYNAGP